MKKVFAFLLLFFSVAQLVAQQPHELFPYRKGELWGFADKTGNIVITPEFEDHAFFNSQGLAIVRKGGLTGAIDQTGKVIVPFEFDDVLISELRDFKPQKVLEVYGQGGFGWYSLDGVQLLPPEYANLLPIPEYAVVMLNKTPVGGGKLVEWELYFPESKTKTSLGKFENIRILNRDMIQVFFPKSEKGKAKTGLINWEGKEILPGKYEKIVAGPEGLALATLDYQTIPFNKDGKAVLTKEEYFIGQIDYFKEGALLVEKDGLRGVKSPQGNWILEPGAWQLGGEAGSYIKVKKGDFWGLVDDEGKTRLDFKFNHIKCCFPGGLIYVLEGHEFGFVNADLKWVIPKGAEDFRFWGENLIALKKEGKWGLFDLNHNEILACVYDEIQFPSQERNGKLINPNWLAVAKKGDQFEVLNAQGQTVMSSNSLMVGVIPTPTKELRILLYNQEKRFYSLLRESGDTLLSMMYDQIEILPDGNFRVQQFLRYGWCNSEGEEVLPAIYEGVFLCNPFYFRCIQDSKFYFMNRKGKLISKEAYPRYSSLNSNYGMVGDASKWALLGLKGKRITDLAYDAIALFPLNGYFETKSGGKLGLIDSLGRTVLPPEFDRITLANDFLLVEKGSRQGLFDFKGQELLPVNYQLISVNADKKVVAADQKGFGVFDPERKTWLLPAEPGMEVVPWNSSFLVFAQEGKVRVMSSDGTFRSKAYLAFQSRDLSQQVEGGLLKVIDESGKLGFLNLEGLEFFSP